jgi:hypothetical protein
VIDTETLDLYDWSHAENIMFRELVWPTRATNFMHYRKPLPGTDVPAGWWDRFTFTDDATAEISDSNMYSGVVNGYETYDHVWLFDAHHDLYTIRTEADMVGWQARGKLSCEDWMFAHHLRGSKLHWRWPQWHHGKGRPVTSPPVPRWVHLDARRDDLRPLDSRHMKFDMVSICRSGAWVPPWCDGDFEKFYTSCPVRELTQVDNLDLVREWDEAAARREFENRRRTTELLHELNR